MAHAHLFTNLQDLDKLFDENTITNLHKFAKKVENVFCSDAPGYTGDNKDLDWMRYDILVHTGKCDDYTILMDIPGVQKEDIDLSVIDTTASKLNSSLKISVERKKMKDDTFLLSTRPYGRYEQTVSLPRDADITQKIEAQYADGVLKVSIKRKQDDLYMNEGRKIHIT